MVVKALRKLFTRFRIANSRVIPEKGSICVWWAVKGVLGAI
jgi:hypothetical protein